MLLLKQYNFQNIDGDLMEGIRFLEEHGLVGYVNFKLQRDLSIKKMDFFDWTNSETNQISISFLNICFNILQEVEEAKVIKERQSEEDDLNELKRRDFRMKKQSRISTEKYIIMKHKLLKIQLRSPVDCVYTINREIKIQIKLGS